MRNLLVVAVMLVLVAGGCGSDDDGAKSTASGRAPYDRAFIDAMVPHHREAIQMARAAKARGLTQSDLDVLADNIIASQQLEIDRMLEWRQEWFGSRALGPVLPEVIGVPEGDLGMEHGADQDIAGAVDVDERFAQLMIPHHRGAIDMAEVAKERAEHVELRELAAAIISAQSSEIGNLETHASGEHHG